ncbi:hypothetical protein CBL_04986 [Carabus blaptoides fortunei]
MLDSFFVEPTSNKHHYIQAIQKSSCDILNTCVSIYDKHRVRISLNKIWVFTGDGGVMFEVSINILCGLFYVPRNVSEWECFGMELEVATLENARPLLDSRTANKRRGGYESINTTVSSTEPNRTVMLVVRGTTGEPKDEGEGC